MNNIDYKVEITSLTKLLIDGLKLAQKEISSYLEIGLKSYLESQSEKYFWTNTFLHRFEKVKFDDIYFPVSLSYEVYSTKFKDISEVFEKYKYITVIGGAGSGKSTLIKYIFLNTLKQKYKIPILIELRHLNEYNGTLTDYIFDRILSLNIKPSGNTLERILNKGNFIFLFDGYDEIFSKRKHQIASDIENFTDKYYQNNYVITTRPGSGIETSQRFFRFNVEELTEHEIYEFVDIMVDNEERNDQIKNIIENSETEDYKDYLSNPLLLSMFILAFENHPEIPSMKSAFYKNVFDTLYSKHDGITKGSFPREKKTQLKREEFEEILAAFCFLSLIEGRYSFTEEYLSEELLLVKKKKNFNYEIEDMIFDLRTSISILIKDGFEYKFPHRSMQEYFAAFFISKLPENKKNKAYERLNYSLQKSSNDFSFNLWKLCKEIDKKFYYKHFILKELKRVSKLLRGKRGKNLIITFFKIWEASLVIFVEIHDKKEDFKVIITREGNIHNSIFMYENVYDWKPLSNFTVAYSKEIATMLGVDEGYFIDHAHAYYEAELYEDSIISFLFEKGADKIISNYRRNINKFITRIEKETKKINDNLDDLLSS
jgi:predicted NACHT family NTPase